MSSSDIKSVSATTGQFPALTKAKPIAVGSARPAGGNTLPPEPAQRPDLEKLAERLNVASQTVGRDLRFKVNLDSRMAVIQVLDRETGEIIRQIPSEKADVYLSTDGAMALRLLDASV